MKKSDATLVDLRHREYIAFVLLSENIEITPAAETFEPAKANAKWYHQYLREIPEFSGRAGVLIAEAWLQPDKRNFSCENFKLIISTASIRNWKTYCLCDE